MQRTFLWLAGLACLLAACGPEPVPVVSATPTPVQNPAAAEIRFGVVGELQDVNIWTLFDQEGAGYANYALMSGYWPRLYTLSIPDRRFIPMAAGEMPSPVAQEGEYYSGTVSLRTDLVWTDGRPFTAEDVVFTVNTAVAFRLGFDWKAYYDYDILHHAEAVDAQTVRFYFKRPPDVGLWQYGALQGPVAQKDYWAPRIAAAAQLLPAAPLTAQVEALNLNLAASQARVDQLEAGLNSIAPGTALYHQIDAELKRARDARNQTAGKLVGPQADYDQALDAARASLYALGHPAEPTLGVWMPAGRQGGAWVNAASPAFPFGRPTFGRAAYRLFAQEEAAVTALENNEVDVLLAPDGLSREIVLRRVEQKPGLTAWHATASRARFIAVNPSNPALADPALRRLFFCALARLPARISLTGESIESFVASDNAYWHNPGAGNTCGTAGNNRLRMAEALKASGYTWQNEPTETEAGVGLNLPGGEPFPAIILLAPAESIDPQRAEAARYFEQTAREFGIPLTAKLVSAEEIRYAVYSSGGYDLAVVGYRLSEYPGYLCDWFAEGNPFGYGPQDLQAACAALAGTSDLEAARGLVFEIQSILVRDLPLIPFYLSPIFDAYRNVTYPFASVPGGLSGVYGAPSLAVPSQ